MSQQQGKIIIAPGVNVWPHEMKTAEALAAAGYIVEFMRRSEGFRVTTADVVINGVIWEMKSPESSQLKVIEKNIRHALHQSRDVIFDSRRMKKLGNERIEQEVRKWATQLTSVRRLIYINRRGEVVKIK
ncbi:MAG: hypothetical protein IJ087_13570 [Eggerthellaceae bacterium]|nr:hypothetical protein [Eggerthellaceae bacterium]